MKIIDQLLKKISKISSKKVFNLRKIAVDEIIEPPVTETPVMEPSTEISSLHAEMQEYIKNNALNLEPEPLHLSIYQNPNEKAYFENMVLQELGTSSGQDFLNRVYIRTENIYSELTEQGYQPEETEAIPTQFSESNDINLEWQYLTDIVIPGKINYIHKAIAKEFGDTEAEEIIEKAIAYRFGNNPDAKVDQRFNFFIKYPDKIPFNVIELLEKDLQEQGKDIKGGKILDFIKAFSHGSNKHLDRINLLKDNNEIKNELLSVLSNLIENNDPIINSWVNSATGYRQMGSRAKQYQETNVPEVGEEGETADIFWGTKEKAELGRFKEDIPEQKQREVAMGDKMIQKFGNEYLSKILDEVKEVSNIVSNNLKTSGNDQQREQGEYLEIYMKSSLDQIKNLLSGEMESAQTETGRVFKNKSGNIKIPESVFQEVFRGLGKFLAKRGQSVDTLSEQGRYDAIKEYNTFLSDTSEFNWLPDWSKLFSGKALANKYKEIGALKKEIKDNSQLNKTIDPDSILMHNPILNQKLYNMFASDETDSNNTETTKKINNEITNFINKTLVQSDEEINKLLYSGEEGGIKMPKNYFRTASKNIMAELYNINKEKEISLPAIKAFLNIMPVHDSIKKGDKEGTGPSSVLKELEEGAEYPENLTKKDYMTHSNIYNSLIRTEEYKLSPLLRQVTDRKKQNEKSEIRKNKNLSDFQKEQEYGTIDVEFESIKKVIKNIKKYHQDKKRLNFLETGKEGKDKTHKGIPQLKKEISKREEKITGYKHDKLGRLTIPIFDTKNRKKLYYIRKNELAVLEQERIDLNNEIHQFEEKYKDSEYAKYANKQIFNIIYAAFLRTQNRITKLSEMKIKYNIIKLSSSHIDSIDDIIIRTKNEFVNLFYKS